MATMVSGAATILYLISKAYIIITTGVEVTGMPSFPKKWTEQCFKESSMQYDNKHIYSGVKKYLFKEEQTL